MSQEPKGEVKEEQKQPQSQQQLLSVQSNVVSGYVGNKCATFALQLLGVDVLPFNTVEYSNHSGYAHRGGTRFDAAHFSDIIAALEKNGLDGHITNVLSGYIASPDVLPVLAKHICKLAARAAARGVALDYVMDPVLGDNGKMYVPEAMLEGYREHLLPLAAVITPNHHELAWLANVQGEFESVTQIVQAARSLGVPRVVVTSIPLKLGAQYLSIFVDLGARAAEDYMVQLVVEADETNVVAFPIVEGNFVGTGDLFTSLLAGARHALAFDKTLRTEYEFNLADCCARAIWVMQKVLKRAAPPPLPPASSQSSTTNTKKVEKEPISSSPFTSLFGTKSVDSFSSAPAKQAYSGQYTGSNFGSNTDGSKKSSSSASASPAAAGQQAGQSSFGTTSTTGFNLLGSSAAAAVPATAPAATITAFPQTIYSTPNSNTTATSSLNQQFANSTISNLPNPFAANLFSGTQIPCASQPGTQTTSLFDKNPNPLNPFNTGGLLTQNNVETSKPAVDLSAKQLAKQELPLVASRYDILRMMSLTDVELTNANIVIKAELL